MPIHDAHEGVYDCGVVLPLFSLFSDIRFYHPRVYPALVFRAENRTKQIVAVVDCVIVELIP